MKILHVVPSYLPAWRYGGPIYSVHGLCKALAARGHRVDVFTTNIDGPSNSDVPLESPVGIDGVNVWYFPAGKARRLFYSPRMREALTRRIREFDIVHLHSVFLWPTWMAARLAKRAGVPYVLSPRGMLDKRLIRRKSRWLKTGWIRLIEQRNVANACVIHVTSDLELEAMKALGIDCRATATIPNGVDLPRVWDEARISKDVRHVIDGGEYVLFLGRIHWKKGLDRLVDAWPGSAGCRLVIAGNDEEGYAADLQRRFPESARGEGIVLLPRTIQGDDKEALMGNARFFVLPSYSENFGNAVLEAMVRGVPVLVTEEVGAGEVVAAAGGGRIVPGAALHDAIVEMLADQAGTKAMGSRAREYAASHCTWDAAARLMTDAYQGCLGTRAQEQ